mgnify:CR=1 FL=1
MQSGGTIENQNRWLAALPPLVDGAAAAALFMWVPALSEGLIQPSGWNALLLLLLYVLFCIGVYLSRKLLPDLKQGRWLPPSWLMDPRMRGALGVIFALFMTTTFAYQLGYFEAIYQIRAGLLEEGSTAVFFVYAPGAWLGFSLLVILVLAFPVNANIVPGDGRYPWFCLISLLLTNALLLFSTAQIRAMINGLGVSPGPLLWLLVFAALALSFLAPRVIYQSRQPYLSGWLSFALLIILAVFAAVI